MPATKLKAAIVLLLGVPRASVIALTQVDVLKAMAAGRDVVENAETAIHTYPCNLLRGAALAEPCTLANPVWLIEAKGKIKIPRTAVGAVASKKSFEAAGRGDRGKTNVNTGILPEWGLMAAMPLLSLRDGRPAAAARGAAAPSAACT